MIFLQLIFNSLVAGCLLAVVAIGFNLVFSTTKVFHLAHGAVYVTGAYGFLFFSNLFNGAGVLCWLLALTTAAAVAWMIEFLVYQPLARRNANQAITLISSLGVYILLVNLLALLFGNQSRLQDPQLGPSLAFGPLIIMPVQFIQLAVSISIIASAWFLSKRRWYLQIRALLSNEQTAVVLGVNARRTRLIVMLLGAVCAAVPAMLRLYDTGIDPHAGMAITLSAVAAVIIGGNGSIPGTIAAALLISFLQATIEYFFSAQWKDGVTFFLLLVVILVRTEGIVSFKMRTEEQ
jgi:branched-chain amino acid transport system permease protein